MTPDDWKGDPIELGTRVIHHVRQSSSIGLKIGHVHQLRIQKDWRGREFVQVKIHVSMGKGYYGAKPGSISHWINIENVTVIG